MAGHSTWSKVKHIKRPLDAKRGAALGKLVKEITVVAHLGGGEFSGNPRLRSVAQTARAVSTSGDNTERAINKDTGILKEKHSGLFHGGNASRVAAPPFEMVVDNKSRTATNLRFISSKPHGNFAASSSVSYPFHKKGQILVAAQVLHFPHTPNDCDYTQQVCSQSGTPGRILTRVSA